MPAATSIFCTTCDVSPRWANHAQCFGCLLDNVKPCDYVPKLATHTDLSVAMAEVRRYVAQWEQQFYGWQLTPDFQRIYEDSAAPSKYADRHTSIGRKLVWARFKVERRHPRGVRPGRLPVTWAEVRVRLAQHGFAIVEVPLAAMPLPAGLIL